MCGPTRYMRFNNIVTEKEQFDEALDRRVWSLSDQRRTWNVEIAKKRRTTPQEVEGLMKNLIAYQREADNASTPKIEKDGGSDMDEGNPLYIFLWFTVSSWPY